MSKQKCSINKQEKQNGVADEHYVPRAALPSRCTYQLGNSRQISPHKHRVIEPRPKILPTILDYIGQTPLVRLNKIPKQEGIMCEVLAKCEFLNPGGSIKDRIAIRMVEDAEESRQIKPGRDILVEATAGNTGVGLSLVSAVKGYGCIVCLPNKYSEEKVGILRALGTNVIRTKLAPITSPDNDLYIAEKMCADDDRRHNLNQFCHQGNPLAHYDVTAEEILEACDGNVDMVVTVAGSGGTLTGLSRKIKEVCPDCKIIGVDTVGSVLADPPELNIDIGCPWYVEGAGQTFKSAVLDDKLIEKWYKVQDQTSFDMARRLIKSEGLLCGGSSGSAMHAAFMAIKEYILAEDDRCVVILPDSMRNYMSKFLDDEWMRDRGFLTIV